MLIKVIKQKNKKKQNTGFPGWKKETKGRK